ncbi:MAG TPA: cytochrome c oxidase subunit 3 [Pirellulales bacterium]|jgi:cytochrome c oxidase subunit 3|nr:cytochrome c oxidase subunit 3 [Pirellulales bacterium]
MSSDDTLLKADERHMLDHSILVRHRLEEQYENLEHQYHAATTAMWVFLATEVMFFGAIFLALAVYHHMYTDAFEKGSEKLEWIIGGTNTIVLLLSSFTIVLAVHYSKLGANKQTAWFLATTAALGLLFLVFKGIEYYLDYKEFLIPGWRFNPQEWVDKEHLSPDQVPHVQLFLVFYWVMTLIHALHVTLGIVAVLIVMTLAFRRHFSPVYYTPVEVLALYWHFVDIVWIFLLPMLYLQGTHTHIGF